MAKWLYMKELVLTYLNYLGSSEEHMRLLKSLFLCCSLQLVKNYFIKSLNTSKTTTFSTKILPVQTNLECLPTMMVEENKKGWWIRF